MSDDLFNEGARAFPWNTFAPTPDVCRGTILEIESRQQTDFDGKPLTWPDGRERKIIVITVQTEERVSDNDDGIRSRCGRRVAVTRWRRVPVSRCVTPSSKPRVRSG